MEIPLKYPKIPYISQNCPLQECVIFDKIDGANIWFEWEKDYGFHSFGTRRTEYNLSSEQGIKEFQLNHPELKEAPEIFFNQWLEKLEKHFLTLPWGEDPITVFMEFVGNNSFNGRHDPNDLKELILFDVARYWDILNPDLFIKYFGDFKTPKIIYQGKFKSQIITHIQEGKFNLKEGAVLKGKINLDDLDKYLPLNHLEDGQCCNLWFYMTKVKTFEYLKKLEEKFPCEWLECI